MQNFVINPPTDRRCEEIWTWWENDLFMGAWCWRIQPQFADHANGGWQSMCKWQTKQMEQLADICFRSLSVHFSNSLIFLSFVRPPLNCWWNFNVEIEFISSACHSSGVWSAMGMVLLCWHFAHRAQRLRAVVVICAEQIIPWYFYWLMWTTTYFCVEAENAKSCFIDEFY